MMLQCVNMYESTVTSLELSASIISLISLSRPPARSCHCLATSGSTSSFPDTLLGSHIRLNLASADALRRLWISRESASLCGVGGALDTEDCPLCKSGDGVKASLLEGILATALPDDKGVAGLADADDALDVNMSNKSCTAAPTTRNRAGMKLQTTRPEATWSG